MNLSNLKSFRLFAAFVAAIVVFTLAGAASPAQAQTYTVVGNVPNNNDANPTDSQIAQGRNGEVYATSVANQGDFSVDALGNFSLLTNSIGGGAGVVLGADGNLYIARNYNNGCGDVYSVTTTGTSTLLAALCGNDGYLPDAAPIEASNGVLYGTASAGGTGSDGTIYSLTTSGTLTVLHTFTGSDGSTPRAPLVVGSDGNLYGGTQYGGTSNDGVLFKITLTGTYTVLHNFTGTDGAQCTAGLVLGSDGNLYGVTIAGGTGTQAGVFFKLTNSGTYTVLYNFQGPSSTPATSLVQATNGVFYGILGQGNSSQPGWIYSLTTSGTFTIVHEFCQQTSCTDGGGPSTPLIQHTNGNFYGFTANGGTCCGVFYSLNIGAQPFISLQSTSGKVGSKVGIFGQGFSGSSVVKFNGVQATTVTLSGTTYLTATVPTGAMDGFVAVTTGSTTLTSTQKYIVHNSWSSGAAIPVPVAGAATGFINGKIYVVGGFTTYQGAPVSNNQIYSPTTNKWTTGAAIPMPVWAPATAVVSGVLYAIGGYEGPQGSGENPGNLVQAYNPTTNTWTTKSAMPTARGSNAAVVDANAIYVIGGNGSTLRLNTVEKYVPSTDTWTEEAPLLVGKSEPSAGLVGTTIVVADGFSSSETGDNEGYTVLTNAWSALTADPNPRNASCYGSLSSQLYVAGGLNSAITTLTTNESYSVSSKKWTTQAAMPTAVVWPGSAVDAGVLYCMGGQGSYTGAVIGNVQIYQP